jgi:hypothetical protein
MPSVVSLGLAGAAGMLLAVGWLDSPHPRGAASKILGWVLMASSAALTLLAAEAPLADSPPPCLQIHGCVLQPRLLINPSR